MYKENFKAQIASGREEIQKEIDIEPMQQLLQRLKEAKQAILRHCLRKGFDVRETGLLWILQELTSEPMEEDFPTFFNSQEIQFILEKHKKEKEAQSRRQEREEEETMKKQTQRSTDDVYEMVVRRKKRELSMIKEGQLLEQLRKKEEVTFKADGHKYIT